MTDSIHPVGSAGFYDDVVIQNNEAEEHIKTVKPRYSYHDKGQNTRGERSTIRLYSPTSQDAFSGLENAAVWEQAFNADNDTKGYADFFLQRVSVGYSEKSQIVQTFGGADVVYYFGQAPVVFEMGGLLFDDIHNGWFYKFATAYTQIMRGTKLAQSQQLVEIETPNLRIIGTIASFQHSQDSARDTDIPFSMSVIAQTVYYKDFTRDGKAHALDGENIPNISMIGANGPTLSQESINSLLADNLDALFADGTFLGTVEKYSNSIAQSTSSITELIDQRANQVEMLTDTVVGFLNRAVSPIETVLGSVRSITNSAVALARSVESSVQKVINVPMRVLYNAQKTEDLVKNSTGIITFVPESLAEQISRFVKDGSLANDQAILEGSKTSQETAAILSTRDNRTGDEGATL